MCSCISKVFEKVVQRRLSEHLDQHEVLHHSQYGFRKQHSAADAQLLMAAATGMGLLPSESKRRGKRWACFIDQRRAFPSVPRDWMLTTLHEHGKVGGRLLRCVANMYEGLTSRVRVGSARSEPYKVESGVREGSCLSATLYAVFLDPLLWELERARRGTRVPVGPAGGRESVYAGAVAYADDLALVADTEADLQRLMDIVGQFASDRGIHLARDKTSVVCFGETEGRRLRARKWTMKALHKPPAADGGTRWDDFVDEKRQYEHLGVLLDSSRSWAPYFEACAAKYTAVTAQGLVHRGIGAFGVGGSAGARVWEAVGAQCLDKACEITASANIATRHNSAMLTPIRKCWKAAVHSALGGRGAKGTATTGIERMTGFRRTESRREEALAKAIARWIALPAHRAQHRIVQAYGTQLSMGTHWAKAVQAAVAKVRGSGAGPKLGRNKRMTEAIRTTQAAEQDQEDRKKPTLEIFYAVTDRMAQLGAPPGVPAPQSRCTGTDYAAWRQLCCSALRLQGLVRNGKSGSRAGSGLCPKCGLAVEDEVHLLGACPGTARARRDFLLQCGADARSAGRALSRDECVGLLAFDCRGISGGRAMNRAHFERIVLQFVGRAVASRFGPKRSSNGTIPDGVADSVADVS